jgi:hypothetical protein
VDCASLRGWRLQAGSSESPFRRMRRGERGPAGSAFHFQQELPTELAAAGHERILCSAQEIAQFVIKQWFTAACDAGRRTAML